MRVEAVGVNTFYGALARDVQEGQRDSPLKLRLGKLAQSVSRMGYIGAALVAFADLFNAIVIRNGWDTGAILGVLHTPQVLIGYLIHAVTLSISVIVVAIPEGLPLMITIVLSSNMKRMLRDNVLVRKLVGIETSGNLNILFADKTGTITKGELKVLFLSTARARVTTIMGSCAKRSSDACCGYQVFIIRARRSAAAARRAPSAATPPNARCWSSHRRSGPRGVHLKVAASVPFSSVNKYSARAGYGGFESDAHQGRAGADPAELRALSGRKRRQADDVVRYGAQKKACARWRRAPSGCWRSPLRDALDTRSVNGNLTLLGIVAIRDEVRREAPKAIRQVVGAGIQVVMITGDNKETAAAIAREVGLIRDDDRSTVLTSDELRRMSDAELRSALPRLRVVRGRCRRTKAGSSPRRSRSGSWPADGRRDQRRAGPEDCRRRLFDGERDGGRQGGQRHRDPR